MPVHRQPLRQRCNIKLSVYTSLSVDDTDEIMPESRGRSRYRRGGPGVRDPRRVNKVAKFSSPQHHRAFPSRVPAAALPPSRAEPQSFLELTPPSSPVSLDLEHIHEIVPFVSLSVSFAPAYVPLSEDIRSGYTHVVRMTYAPIFHASTEYHSESGTSVLNLSVPAPPTPESKINVRVTKSGRRVKNFGPFPSSIPCTSMSHTQLLLARDFLSLALPYYSYACPPSPSIPRKAVDEAQVLIIAPTTVDALSVVICYLAWASEESTAAIVGYIDEEEQVPIVWRSVFGQDIDEDSEGVEKIESVARKGM